MSDSPDAAIPAHPTDVLIDLIAAFLTPMFLPSAGGDAGFARMAAVETINAYRVRDQADLILVAQIIAFGLAALGSLSLSMEDDVPVSRILRLRANANACQRSAETIRRARAANRVDAACEPPPEPEPEPRSEHDLMQEVAATRARVAKAQAEGGPRPARQLWAAAAANVAAEYASRLPHLPPAQRREASIRAKALASSADTILADSAFAWPATAAS